MFQMAINWQLVPSFHQIVNFEQLPEKFRKKNVIMLSFFSYENSFCEIEIEQKI
jgi:hypothetical protein